MPELAGGEGTEGACGLCGRGLHGALKIRGELVEGESREGAGRRTLAGDFACLAGLAECGVEGIAGGLLFVERLLNASLQGGLALSGGLLLGGKDRVAFGGELPLLKFTLPETVLLLGGERFDGGLVGGGDRARRLAIDAADLGLDVDVGEQALESDPRLLEFGDDGDPHRVEAVREGTPGLREEGDGVGPRGLEAARHGVPDREESVGRGIDPAAEPVREADPEHLEVEGESMPEALDAGDRDPEREFDLPGHDRIDDALNGAADDLDELVPQRRDVLDGRAEEVGDGGGGLLDCGCEAAECSGGCILDAGGLVRDVEDRLPEHDEARDDDPDLDEDGAEEDRKHRSEHGDGGPDESGANLDRSDDAAEGNRRSLGGNGEAEDRTADPDEHAADLEGRADEVLVAGDPVSDGDDVVGDGRGEIDEDRRQSVADPVPQALDDALHDAERVGEQCGVGGRVGGHDEAEVTSLLPHGLDRPGPVLEHGNQLGTAAAEDPHGGGGADGRALGRRKPVGDECEHFLGREAFEVCRREAEHLEALDGSEGAELELLHVLGEELEARLELAHVGAREFRREAKLAEGLDRDTGPLRGLVEEVALLREGERGSSERCGDRRSDRPDAESDGLGGVREVLELLLRSQQALREPVVDADLDERAAGLDALGTHCDTDPLKPLGM